MRIASFSNWQLKFLGMINDHWRKQGHEVKYALGYDPALHEWSDVCYVDVGDNNAQVASKRRFPNSRLVIRIIDIEAWVGQPGGVQWENADVCIFGAKHIEELVRSYVNFPPNVQVVHIPFGVDLSKWTFKVRDGRGKQVAHIAHQWPAKGLQLLFQVMAKLGPSWTLHTLGTKSRGDPWQFAYYDHIVKELGINHIHIDSVPDVNEWLEDKDYQIVASMKEAFSYAAAESAAKGIRPLIHNFYRAKDIWPESWIWDTVDDCVRMMTIQPYESIQYRDVIEQTYSLSTMMDRINKVCHIKE